jgi:hypothetical protein
MKTEDTSVDKPNPAQENSEDNTAAQTQRDKLNHTGKQ